MAMTKRGWVIGLFVGLAAAFAGVAAASDNYRLINGTTDFYYGHVSLVDIKSDGKDPVVLREGACAAEPATLNLPLGPGDTIMTTGERRLGIQFDNGTTLRLDANTELKIETVMAQSLSERTNVTNLVLRSGRVYVMYKQYSSKEMFQIVTPNAAVKMAHNAVATIGAPAGGTDLQIAFGRADVLYGPNPERLIEKTVAKNETMKISPAHTAEFGTAGAPTDFEAWNADINKHFDELHKGKTMIPKPVQRLNPAVFYFAQQYGNLYGEWIYDDYFGYVWRPFTNDMRYPNGAWSPYIVGRWSEYNGQMFWVAEEPWGWIPYHLGVWHWDTKRGWYWLPGSAFAPAWVDWAFFGGTFYGWRPWSMWDWGCYGEIYSDMAFPYLGMGMSAGYPFGGFADDYWFRYFWGGYYGWRYPWIYGGGSPDVPAISGDYWLSGGKFVPPLSKVSKGQIQKPGAAPFQMPKEFAGGLKALLAALKKGDATAVGSFQAVGKQTLVVGASDLHLGGLHNRAVRLDQLMGAVSALGADSPQKTIMSLPPRSAQNSAYNAGRDFEQNMRLSMLKSFVAGRAAASEDGSGRAPEGRAFFPASGPGRAANGPALKAATRARDWNPDIKIGVKNGVEIVYLSHRNEVYAPQLRISSSMAANHPVLTADGRARLGWNGGSGGGGGDYSSGGSYSGGSSSGGGSVSASGGASSGGSSGASASSGGGGHIRN
jgi:hypothetical protein